MEHRKKGESEIRPQDVTSPERCKQACLVYGNGGTMGRWIASYDQEVEKACVVVV